MVKDHQKSLQILEFKSDQKDCLDVDQDLLQRIKLKFKEKNDENRGAASKVVMDHEIDYVHLKEYIQMHHPSKRIDMRKY